MHLRKTHEEYSTEPRTAKNASVVTPMHFAAIQHKVVDNDIDPIKIHSGKSARSILRDLVIYKLADISKEDVCSTNFTREEIQGGLFEYQDDKDDRDEIKGLFKDVQDSLKKIPLFHQLRSEQKQMHIGSFNPYLDTPSDYDFLNKYVKANLLVY